MPGRYLLIEFDDEQSATRLRAQIESASEAGKPFRVVGVFNRPGTPCMCIHGHDARAADLVKRGGKFGWWVCTTCGKPRLGNHELINQILPFEQLAPRIFSGVDDNTPNADLLPYFRHIQTLPIITYPARVANASLLTL